MAPKNVLLDFVTMAIMGEGRQGGEGNFVGGGRSLGEGGVTALNGACCWIWAMHSWKFTVKRVCKLDKMVQAVTT